MLAKEERREVLHDALYGFIDEVFCLDLDQPEHTRNDQVNTYATELLSYYFLYIEFEDAIAEGDGDRLIRCWKILFWVFYTGHRMNYTLEAFRILMQYYYILSPRQAQQLLWSRFINNHGRGGKNIEADLHAEHLIRVCKSYLAALGANVTDAAVLRAGKCIGTTSQVTAQYDTATCVHPSSDRHSDLGITKDLEKVVYRRT